MAGLILIPTAKKGGGGAVPPALSNGRHHLRGCMSLYAIAVKWRWHSG